MYSTAPLSANIISGGVTVIERLPPTIAETCDKVITSDSSSTNVLKKFLITSTGEYCIKSPCELSFNR
jgi:hypothetical protein